MFVVSLKFEMLRSRFILVLTLLVDNLVLEIEEGISTKSTFCFLHFKIGLEGTGTWKFVR